MNRSVEAEVSPARQTPGAPTPGQVVVGHELVRRFGEGATAVEALRGVSLELARGSFTAIMGPSGSGKSTLMHILAGLDRPTEGWVELAGVRLDQLSDHDLTVLRRERIGFVFQTYNLLPVLTAEENVSLPVRIGGDREDREWLDELFDAIGLEERRAHRPSELSGGEQQRVAICLALVNDPALILADEPTGNLDSANMGLITDLLLALAHEQGKTVVVATHDPKVADAFARIYYMRDGQFVEGS
jgi:putative ABC transport system ATP-binding protein